MYLCLLLLAFFLPPKARAGEIIGGHESKPHSRPYMAYLQFVARGVQKCGGFLIREDFVLTALEKKANLNPAVQPIKLPRSKDKVKPGKVCLVAGWGRVAPNGKYPNTLQEVKLKVQKHQVCEREELLKEFYKSSIQICVGDPKENKASFQGDSGGPLVCNHVAQGIVSSGKSNRKPPGIYTKVSRFLQWIKETMKSHQLQGTD
uniref:Peptidase S1 domain-containing protein n=1 Tax=Spermophilus dauricus TaxID=99837 RepID=A0A8C9QVA9_SPEDA